MMENRKKEYLNVYNEWLKSEYIDEEDKKELLETRNSDEEIKDRFYKDLEFGTGGLRGVIGIGTNRINIYTVRKATQGLASYLIEKVKDSKNKGVAIAYDSRNFSDVFALEVALVFAGNGIKAYLFESLRSTPELSFAVRYLNCASGIVITASHNPPEYNGYKVYNQDGGQITLEFANGIIESIRGIDEWNKINRMDKEKAISSGLLDIIGSEVDNTYITEVVNLVKTKRIANSNLQDKLSIVYTPLHGTGLMPITKSLSQLGYSNIHIVEKQAIPDGNFPTLKSPNPEEHDAFKLGIDEAKKAGSDVIIGTDPDCDRIGVAIKNNEGQYRVLSGNQVGALLVNYIIQGIKNVTSKHAIIKTIVTSDLGAKIAEKSGATVINTLTGFKFIGEKIKQFEENGSHDFLFGYEESYGYLAGTFVRDKDAVIAACLVIEMISYYKQLGKNLYDALEDIYEEYGYYVEALDTFVYKGAEGSEKMKKIMMQFRNINNLTSIFPDIEKVEDYKLQKTYYALNGTTKENIKLPKSNVIKIIFNEGSWVALRPSGTEPKLKVYYSMISESLNNSNEKLLSLRNQLTKHFFKL